VTGGPQFTHVAGYHAGIVIKNMMFKLPAKIDYSALPWVTYTDPELAQVGMNEQMAIEKYGAHKINIVKWRFEENDRAKAQRRGEGLLKVITLKNGRIIGASIVGKNAGELLQVWSLAISKKMKIKDLTEMIVPYPTFSEMNKRAAGAYFEGKLFSDRTRWFIQLLQKLHF
jgi:pyruvate/2-oxoglutarate dehydrogenase complex dihydrolipoamide dehydrogenase (E3) component